MKNLRWYPWWTTYTCVHCKYHPSANETGDVSATQSARVRPPHGESDRLDADLAAPAIWGRRPANERTNGEN